MIELALTAVLSAVALAIFVGVTIVIDRYYDSL